MSKKVYTAIDVAKLVFSLGIVILHSSAYTVLPSVLPFVVEKYFLRLAVPFFFAVSGFFLGERLKKKNDAKTVIFQYVKRLLLPFAVFGGVNTVLEVVKMVMNGAENIAVTILQHVLFYPYGALWYVSASMVGALLLLPFVRKGKLNSALAVGAVLYVFALLCNNYYFIAEWIGLKHLVDCYLAIFISARNGLFIGFFMLGIGVKLSTLDTGSLETSRIVWTAVLFILYMLETLYIRRQPAVDDKAYYVLQILLVPSLVLVLLDMPLPLSERISKLCRSLSTSIYFQHRMWLSLLTILGVQGNPVLRAGLTLLLCLLTYAIAWASKNEMLIRLLC